MPGKAEARLAALGVALPESAPPAANYLPYVVSGSLVFLSGHVPLENGVRKFLGKLGREFSVEQGQKAAELCAIGMLARLRDACGGDLDRVARCVKLLGFVNATEDFGNHPRVVNGASDLLVKVFGDAGRHARSAIGVASLPSGAAVELEGVFELRQ